MKHNYKYLLGERQWLRVAERARRLNGCQLIAILYKDNELIFKTVSGTDHKTIWTQRIIIDDVSPRKLRKLKFNQLEKTIKYSGLHIDCNCLAEGTRILTKLGYKEIQNVSEQDDVLGGDGKWHRVIMLKRSEVKGNWVAITCKGLRDKLFVSKDHKLLFSTYRDNCACGCGKRLKPCSDNTRMQQAFKLYRSRNFIPKHARFGIHDNFERYQLHEVGSYKLGELLCAPIVQGNADFDKNYARMLGYYLAEGSMQDSGTAVEFTLNQNEEFTIAKDIIDYFNSKGVRTRKKLIDIQKTNQHWLRVWVYSSKFKNDCVKYCGRHSKLKSPSTEVLFWNRDARESFLIGHLLGDGAVDDSFRWLSTSKDMVDMLQMIINSLGVHACTYVANYNTGKGNRSVCYAVSCSINEFYSTYEKYKWLFRDKDLISLNNSRGQNDVDKYALYKIINIEEVEPRYGYDICLEDEPHTYVANNIIVSNCPAFKYWGARYWAWKRGYGIVKETRFPYVRAPHGEIRACKHIFQVMQVLPFLSKTLAKKFRDNLKPENDAQLESNMSDEELDKKGMKELEDSEK